MGWYERAVAWGERHRFAIDAVGTTTAALFVVPASLATVAGGSLGRSGTWELLAWSVALVAPLAWRRVQPVWSTAVVAAAALSHLLLGPPIIFPADLAVLWALYAVTAYGPVWAHRAALGLALMGAAMLGGTMSLAAGDVNAGAAMAITASITALAAWAFGLVRRSRRETLEALRDRALRLEIERDQQAQIATAAERARIAREMHDIVAHSLSVIVAQADGGRYAAQADPQAAARVLGVVSETGRAALADMRRLLGVLRSDDAPRATTDAPHPLPSGSRAPLAPMPGTVSSAVGHPAPVAPAVPAGLAPGPDDADLESLLEQARGAGMRVSLVRVGDPRRLPPGAGLTLHRVCQEALTNVRKHAGPEVSVTVVTRWGPRSVELEVADDGRGAAAEPSSGDGRAGSSGYGLLGMRERAAMFGGSVTAGPRPGGGWRVRFSMPLPEETKETA
ncbi:sensor histidine kinase [Xylanimonas oleitrophica]|uniref:histidine kinase n=1 Tax=Xylanimonas oleitrophica TaxID=2607479 RepID=A0A2W5WS32_9MICO|nr:histidine kinase [Xylanimonas oleitrophica]PZR54319.1 sensor histidine kinase [Xylanimonas oleitrophica]